MTKDFIYWFLMFLIVLAWLFGGYSLYDQPNRRFFGAYLGVGLFNFLLFVIIGLKLFGEPIR